MSGIELTLTLSQLREYKNLKQIDIRNRLNISDRSFRMKEKGESEFTLSEARTLSQIYNLCLDDLCKVVDNTTNFLKAKKDNIQK